MKNKYLFLSLYLVIIGGIKAQIDPALLKRIPTDSAKMKLNMDAVYARPFLQAGKLPVALGGYAEACYRYMSTNGISEGHQFQMQRLTLFVSSAIANRIKFLTEVEFEDGTKEINIEFASLDFEFSPLLNLRGGIVMNPIGAFNQNHDGPKWEFVDRPVSATQLLPATFSNTGFGLYGKRNRKNWVLGYEAYLTNGLNAHIISNTQNKTFLPAVKEDPNRFEESFNGQPLLTGKLALRNRKWGELGISYMGGIYNKFEEDGLQIDRKRKAEVLALDFNTRLPVTQTTITGEWTWIWVNVPATYTKQFGNRQCGGFVDVVQPVLKRPVMGFEKSVINVALRIEYVDWNLERFETTGDKTGENFWSLMPALSWRPVPQTVLRLNYRYQWQRDFLNNSPSRTGGFLLGLSTYF